MQEISSFWLQFLGGDDIKLTKIQDTAYAVSIKTGLTLEHRYIIIYLNQNDNLPLETILPITDLFSDIKSLRLVTFNNKLTYKISEFLGIVEFMQHQYTAGDLGITRIKIENNEKGKKISTYNIDTRSETISLIHNTKTDEEFVDRGSIIVALNTWNTIITFPEPEIIIPEPEAPKPLVLIQQLWRRLY